MTDEAEQTGEAASGESDDTILVLMEGLFSILAVYDIGGGNMQTALCAVEAFVVGAITECDMTVDQKRAMANRIRDMVFDRVRLDS